MGGHWGTSSDRSTDTVHGQGVADALEDWTYSTHPSGRDAVARRLAKRFPDATVRRGDGSTAADVIVDDVRVLIARRFGPSLRRDFHMLAAEADGLVVYSTTCHTATPNEWREFRHRCRGRHANVSVRFVHRRDVDPAAGSNRVRALATMALPVLAIGGLLAALGLFGTGESVAGLEGSTGIGVAAVAVGALVAVALARRRVSVALLKRIPHT